MKKNLTIIAVIVLAVVLMTTMAACGGADVMYPELTLAAKQPEAEAKVAVSADMSALEMMQAALVNYYHADYIASVLQGLVSTSVGPIKIDQLVVGSKVRSGAAYTDDECKTYNPDMTLFTDNKSHSIAAAVYEEVIVEGTDNIRVRQGDKIKSEVNEETKEYLITAGKYKEVEEFTSMEELIEYKVNDPARIWMYDINVWSDESIVKEASEVKDEGDCYTFTIDFALDKVTEKYKNVMIYMLKAGGADPKEVTFQGLKIQFEIWKNGFLRTIHIEEKYHVVLKIMNINTDITLNSRQEFGYAEMDGWKIADKVALF